GRLAAKWRAPALASADAEAAIAADPFLKEAYELRGLVAVRGPERAVIDFTTALSLAESGAFEQRALSLHGRAIARLALDDKEALAAAASDVAEAIRSIPASVEKWVADDR